MIFQPGNGWDSFSRENFNARLFIVFHFTEGLSVRVGFNYIEGFNFQVREPSAEITEKVPVLEAVPYGFYLFFFFGSSMDFTFDVIDK